MLNDRLTEYELESLHGMPVWVRNNIKNGYWCIVNAKARQLVGINFAWDGDEEKSASCLFSFDLLKEGWTAHKEHVTGDWFLNPHPYENMDDVME